MRSSRIACLRMLGMAGLLLCSLASSAAALPELAPSDPAEAARAKSLEEACVRATCRTESRELQFKLSGGTVSMQTDLLPYADEGNIILYPGDAFEVDFAADGKAMESPHFSRTLDQVEQTTSQSGSRAKFSFEFRQTDTGMMLQLRNDLGYRVKYDATIFVPEKDGLHEADTSSCPVIPHGTGSESWPHPIAMIVLSSFRIVADGDLNCH